MDIRILIIDDDELVAMSLDMILNAEDGMTAVGKGYSGADAIRLYDELLPDVLLMDIRMKDMTGLDAAEQILAAHTDAKILFLTTFSDDEYIVKALQLGVKGYLLKQDYRSVASSIRAVYNGQNVFGGAVVEKLPGLMRTDRPVSGEKNGVSASDITNSRNGNSVSGETSDDMSSHNVDNFAASAAEHTNHHSADCSGKSVASVESEEEKIRKNYISNGITDREYQLIQLVAKGLSNKEIADRVFLSEGTVKNYLSSILDKLDLRDRTQLAVYYYENR